jgi:uncharacterized protein
MVSVQHVERRITGALLAALAASPVVAITGPRTAGKSTLARELVAAKGGTLLDLDDPAVRRLATEDPTAFVRALAEPVVVDEFQRAPDILAAIKAELNQDRRPGRFVLTGSARHDVVPELAEFLTGRVDLQTLWPFAEAEMTPGAPPIVDRLFDGSVLRRRRTSALPREKILDLVVRGGYPIAVGLPVAARTRWFANLATLVVERISEDVAPVRHTDVVSRFLQVCAARTAQLFNAADVGREIGLGRDQAATYLRLLELAYLTIQLPAWSTNRIARVVKRSKLHLVDSGLAAHLQGITTGNLSPVDPTAVSLFGALLETFVVTEVLKQLGWSSTLAKAFHFRTNDGVEVDLVLEALDGRICAIEVKTSAGLPNGATRGLEYLRDRLGDRFVAGLVLNVGEHTQRIGDRLAVAPIDALWR